MSKEKPTAADGLSVLLTPALVVWEGFVFNRLWSWHVVPVVHWPDIPLGHAVGIIALFSFFRHSPSRQTNDKGLLEQILDSAVVAGCSLLIGWWAS